MFLNLQTENKIKSFNVNQTQVFKDVLISITRDMKTSLSTTDLESYGLNTDDLVINMITTNLNIAYKKFHSHNQTLTIQEAVGEDVLRELSSKQKEALDAINLIFQDNDRNLNLLIFRLDEIKNSCEWYIPEDDKFVVFSAISVAKETLTYWHSNLYNWKILLASKGLKSAFSGNKWVKMKLQVPLQVPFQEL